MNEFRSFEHNVDVELIKREKLCDAMRNIFILSKSPVNCIA